MTLAELKALAEAADGAVGSWPNAGWFSVLGHTKKDAAYIAAIRPDVILALVEVAEALKEERYAWPGYRTKAAFTALAEKMERLP